MKKITALLLTALFLLPLTACSPKEALIVPQYPLTAEYMQEYLDSLKEGYIVKDNSFPNDYDDMKNITLGIADKEFTEFEQVGITSTTYKGERSLSMTFASGSSLNFGYDPSNSGEKYDTKSSEKVIVFATKLFGEFSGEDAVYKQFKKEFGKKNTQKGEINTYSNSQIHTWTAKIDGITCEVKFTQPDVDKDEMYLYAITFLTDPELYEQRNQQRIKDLNLITD